MMRADVFNSLLVTFMLIEILEVVFDSIASSTKKTKHKIVAKTAQSIICLVQAIISTLIFNYVDDVFNGLTVLGAFLWIICIVSTMHTIDELEDLLREERDNKEDVRNDETKDS